MKQRFVSCHCHYHHCRHVVLLYSQWYQQVVPTGLDKERSDGNERWRELCLLIFRVGFRFLMCGGSLLLGSEKGEGKIVDVRINCMTYLFILYSFSGVTQH